jgi:hypothetical protein
MNYKAHIIRGLLNFYPEKWRIEYGEELDALLLSRPLNGAIISDVLRNGLRQRLRQIAPWKVIGALLFAWTIIGLSWNSATAFSPAWYSRYYIAGDLFLLLGGCWTTLRSPTTISRAAWFTTKAALVSTIPEAIVCLLWSARIVHPTVLDLSGSPVLHGNQITLLYFRGSIILPPIQYLTVLFVITLAQGWAIGLVGGTLGSLAIHFKTGIRRY